MGDSSSPPPAPNVYQYGGMGQADQSALGGMNTMAGGQNYAGNLYNQFGGGLANSAFSGGPNANATGAYLQGQGQNMFGQGNQLMQMGLDPQQSLYNQQFQQNVDQTRAAEAARGIAMTPYGAGLEATSNQTFNNNWLNNQFNRATQAAGAAQGLYGQGGAMMSTGQMLPAQYNAAQIGNLTGLQGAGNMAYALPQQNINNYLNYLQGGTSANNAATSNYGQQLNAWNAQNQQNNAMFGGIGRMAGGLMPLLF